MRKRSALDGLRPLCYPLSSPMKSLFVSDLAAEQTITSFFLVQEKEIRNTREGKSYLRLSLGDRTGAVQARVEVYRDRPQLSVLQVRRAKPEEIEISDFLPHTKHDVEKLWSQLLEYA